MDEERDKDRDLKRKLDQLQADLAAQEESLRRQRRYARRVRDLLRKEREEEHWKRAKV